MIRRFRVSIGQPGKIGQFLKDKIGIIIGYVALLSLLCSIPSIITVCSYKGFTTNTVSEIMDIYKSAKSATTDELIFIPSDAKIVDYKLEGEKEGAFRFYNGVFGIGINKNNYSGYINFNFKESELEITATSVKIKSYSYEELMLDNVDFNILDESEAQFTKIISALDYVIKDTQGIWGVAYVAVDYFSNVISHLFSALLLAVAMIFTSIIPFRFIFRITIYSATVCSIGTLLGQLFGNATVGSFIGFVLAFIFTVRSMKNIIAIKR